MEAESLSRGARFTKACKRRALRYRPEHAEQAYVELRLADGSHWRLSLLEIGGGGICFGLDSDRPTITVGLRIEDVTIQAGDSQFTGSLRVAHVTTEFASGTICGAEFTPATDADQRELASLLARLDAQGQRSD